MVRDLTFSDWPMFDRVMRHPDVCKRFLQVVLDIDVKRLDYVDIEKSLIPDASAKFVRLDVFAKDPGRIYDVEMQILPDPALGKRLRYYQAAMDVTSNPAGVQYDDLPESFIIFVCKHDPFGKGIPIYTFRMHCSENGSVDLGCDFEWIILNSRAWMNCKNDALKSLLKYVYEGTVGNDALVESIDELVRQANESRAWKEEAMGVMTLEHHMRAHISMARKEGLAEGMNQGEALEAARYSRLIDKLLDAGRSDDLRRAAHDDAYRDRLFKEFDIT